VTHRISVDDKKSLKNGFLNHDHQFDWQPDFLDCRPSERRLPKNLAKMTQNFVPIILVDDYVYGSSTLKKTMSELNFLSVTFHFGHV